MTTKNSSDLDGLDDLSGLETEGELPHRSDAISTQIVFPILERAVQKQLAIVCNYEGNSLLIGVDGWNITEIHLNCMLCDAYETCVCHGFADVKPTGSTMLRTMR